jgi:hypothetical protein
MPTEPSAVRTLADDPPPAARVLALRVALRAMPVRADLHPMNAVPAGEEEMHRLRLLVGRGLLVAFASAVYDGVPREASARAAAALDACTAPLDAGRATFYANCGYGSDYHISSIEGDYDCARLVVRWLREALAEAPRIAVPRPPDPLFETLQFFGPEGRQQRADWIRVQADAHAADRARLGADPSAGAARALALAPLWPDATSAAVAANLTFRAWQRVARTPTPLGENTLRWLAERTPGALVLGHAPGAEAERLGRIATLPVAFWDGTPAAVGYTLDDCLGRRLVDPLWGAVRPWKP